ncbi:MAG: hypothetical protein ACPGGD_00220 [Thalassolituus sp.]
MWIQSPSMILIAVFSLSSLAGGAVNTEQHQRAQDDYYASDLHTAITEAKVRTHHYDYSNEHRYNRTTSQSIQFSRMLNNELDSQVIETPSLGGVNETNTDESDNLNVATVNMLQEQDNLSLDGGNMTAPQTSVNLPPLQNNNITISVTPR